MHRNSVVLMSLVGLVGIGVVGWLALGRTPSPKEVCARLVKANRVDATATTCMFDGQGFAKAETSIRLIGPLLKAKGVGLGTTELLLELAAFEGEIVKLPDPDLIATFRQSKIDHARGFHETLGGHESASSVIKGSWLLTRGDVAVVLVPIPSTGIDGSSNHPYEQTNQARTWLIEEMSFQAERL